MNYIKENNNFDDLKNSKIAFIFNKVKHEIKYEKMILFYILNFIFINNCSIQQYHISFS